MFRENQFGFVIWGKTNLNFCLRKMSVVCVKGVHPAQRSSLSAFFRSLPKSRHSTKKAIAPQPSLLPVPHFKIVSFKKYQTSKIVYRKIIETIGGNQDNQICVVIKKKSKLVWCLKNKELIFLFGKKITFAREDGCARHAEWFRYTISNNIFFRWFYIGLPASQPSRFFVYIKIVLFRKQIQIFYFFERKWFLIGYLKKQDLWLYAWKSRIFDCVSKNRIFDFCIER